MMYNCGQTSVFNLFVSVMDEIPLRCVGGGGGGGRGGAIKTERQKKITFQYLKGVNDFHKTCNESYTMETIKSSHI